MLPFPLYTSLFFIYFFLLYLEGVERIEKWIERWRVKDKVDLLWIFLKKKEGEGGRRRRRRR